MIEKKYRVKANPETPFGKNNHLSLHGGDVYVFWLYGSAYATTVAADGGAIMSNGTSLISITQLEPINEFTFDNGYCGLNIKDSTGYTFVHLPNYWDSAQIDQFEANHARKVRGLREALEYREGQKNDKRQKYIDQVSGVITPAAAGALFDAGFTLKKD